MTLIQCAVLGKASVLADAKNGGLIGGFVGEWLSQFAPVRMDGVLRSCAIETSFSF